MDVRTAPSFLSSNFEPRGGPFACQSTLSSPRLVFSLGLLHDHGVGQKKKPFEKLLLCAGGAFQTYATPGFVLALLRHVAEDVRVAVSPAGEKLVSRYAIEVASRHEVFVDIDQRGDEIHLPHIELAQWADLILVFPATAGMLGKIAGGLCDELIPATILAASCPVLIQPITNPTMWESAPVRRNVDLLRNDGFTVADPLPAIEVGTREGLADADVPFPYPPMLARLKSMS